MRGIPARLLTALPLPAVLVSVPLPALALLVLVSTDAAGEETSARAGERASEGTTVLSARRLTADKQGLVAEGEVRVELGACQLNAQQLDLRWGTPPRFTAAHACFVQNSLEICARQVRLGGKGALDAQLVSGTLCRCPGGSRLLGFSARAARIAPGGARLHLSWPTLRVGSLPLLKLPYLALPLRPGVSGLLWPSLSYSERDGLRLEQGVYLATDPAAGGRAAADLTLAGGWVQHRGPSARAKVRVQGEASGARLALRGVLEGEEVRGLVRGRVHGASDQWAAAIVADVARDAEFLRDVETAVSRVFAPYLRSRAWTWSAWRAASAELAADLYQDLEAPQRQMQPWLGRTSLTLGLLPVRVVGPLQVFGDATLEQEFAPTGRLALHGRAVELAPAWVATYLSATPSLGLALRAGPLRLSSTAGYGLQGVLATDRPHTLAQVAAGSLEASLPIARSFRAVSRLRHTIEPALGLAWARLFGSAIVLPEGLALLQGAVLRAGLYSMLQAGRNDEPVRRLLAARARFELPLAEDLARAEWLASAELEVALLARSRAKLAATWDGAREELSSLIGELCWHGGIVQPCAGYARARIARVEELLGVDERPGWLGPINLVLPLELATDQVYGSLRVSWRNLGLGGRVAVDPSRGQLSHANYWLDLVLGCGCYRLGLAGSSWAGQRWPDVLARFSYVGGGNVGGGNGAGGRGPS